MYLLSDIILGLAVGAMAAICFIYVFRSKYSYPRWMLQSFENPWVFILLFTLAIILMVYDQKVASLLLILTLALFVDMYIFAKYIPPSQPPLSAPPQQPPPIIENMPQPQPQPPEDHGVSLLPLTVDPPIDFPENNYSSYLAADQCGGMSEYKERIGRAYIPDTLPVFNSAYEDNQIVNYAIISA
jgi:hypothetical protein